MSTKDSQGNLHDSSGRFAEKQNSAPSQSLGRHVAAVGKSRRLGMVSYNPAHREGYDLVVEAVTGRYYLRDGVPHREGGPAYEGNDGSAQWLREGKLHREDGPAVVDDGYQAFYSEGEAIKL